MNLTGIQKEALSLILDDTKALSKLGGYAGTGKTTVLAEAARSGRFDILTPTNKAADVLRSKGVEGARTLHSVLYDIRDSIEYRNSEGDKVFLSPGAEPPEGYKAVDSRLSSARKEEAKIQSPVAVVDEASMLRDEDLEALLEVYTRVVLIGDPFQLPPVRSRDVFAGDVDLFLTEVHRTALDNPITAFATELRSGGNPEPDGDRIVRVPGAHPKLFERLVAVEAQCVVWTNALRHHVNAQYRRALGLPPGQPKAGERLVCLTNVRRSDDEGNPRLVAYNGQTLHLASDAPEQVEGPTDVQALEFEGVETFRHWPFWAPGYHKLRDSADWYEAIRRVPRSGAIASLDYAYALTAHKSQGSEWPNVAVWDQRGQQRARMGEQEAARWFYTAATRARERLILVSV